MTETYDRFGSVAVVHPDSSPMAALGWKADTETPPRGRGPESPSGSAGHWNQIAVFTQAHILSVLCSRRRPIPRPG